VTRELLFSVTAADCRFDYMRGTGPGGQKRNKTESKVRCTHVESGAVGESDETRDQRRNRQLAFRKMAETEQFKRWHHLEVARRTGSLLEVEQRVDRMMDDVVIETYSVDQRKWVGYEETDDEQT
jgi:protein subunit release factor B